MRPVTIFALQKATDSIHGHKITKKISPSFDEAISLVVVTGIEPVTLGL